MVSSALTSAWRAWRTPMASPIRAASRARRAQVEALAGGDASLGPQQTLCATQVEALRPLGLRLLRGVLRRFGAAPDPLAEGGGLLLAQHQAQFVAALRGALAPGGAPVAAAAGAGLAAAFLAAGLAGGDAAVLGRLLGLLCAPLAAWDAPREEARPAHAPYPICSGAVPGARQARLVQGRAKSMSWHAPASAMGWARPFRDRAAPAWHRC